MLKVSAPGKCILLGEHAVVYGHPALAISIDMRLEVNISKQNTPSNYHVVDSKPLKNLQHPHIVNALNEIWGPKSERLNINVSSEIPPSAGLGSSAALSVAIATGLKTMTNGKNIDLEEISSIAHKLEANAQNGLASPMDTATSTHGGCILLANEKLGENWLYSRKLEEKSWEIHSFELNENIKNASLVIGHTGIHAPTAEMVKGVKQRLETNPQLKQDIDAINDYVQYSPFNMSAPTFKTETRMFYSDEGIYIFSRMYDDNPEKIQQRLANRDDYQNGFIESSDWVYFAFDSRHDHQTGYVFAINCSGVKVDAAIYDDEGFDLDYNSLWYGETNIDELGWTAEIMIPFSALRFDSEVNEVWGFNTKRYIYRLDEISTWVSFPFEVNGISSTFGHIEGFKDIKNFKKIKLIPYISYNGTIKKDSDLKLDQDGYIISGNTFNKYDTTLTTNNFGFDLKYNFNTRSAIDFSFNPDFGQVEVDPADINISYYETYLDEKRPFFIENQMMFSSPIEMFYSRRIGAFKDLNNYNIEIPTAIDYAIKLSGKENNGFSYGLISASTNNEINDTLSLNPDIENNTYNIVRFKQDILGGNSFIGVMATNYEGLRGTFIKDGDTYINNEGIFSINNYSIDSKLNFLDNSLQTNFQIAQSETPITGNANSLSINYDFNEYWSTYMSYDHIDQNFDNNDIGYIKRNDIKSQFFELTYNDFNPTNIFIERSLSLGILNDQNISQGIKLKNQIFVSTRFDFMNNNSILFGLLKSYNGYDDKLLFDYKDNLLAGESMFIPSYQKSYFIWESDLRNINSFTISLVHKRNKIKDNDYSFTFNQTYRPQHNIKISFDYFYHYGYNKYHWLETINEIITNNDDMVIDEIPHHIFGEINKDFQKYTIRFDAFISKDITLQNYTEFIRTNHKFSDYKELIDNLYPESSDFINEGGGVFGNPIPIYASENIDPIENQHPNPSNDVFFYSKYSELIYNLVLRWNINSRSNFYLVYTRYWLVNGKRFKTFFDFLNYSDGDPWVESSFDQGITMKYTYEFDL